jgi:2-polyprenyl-6-methoxyphenol hydroxylase-like FAD-dependent oxidoreductase
MRIAVLGGGPAGLYVSYLLKRRRPEWRITLYEQNPPDATFGFGVVFSDRALEFLREDDQETYDLITPRMQSWQDITINHAGESVKIDGIGFSAIGRLELLQLLQSRLASVEIDARFRERIDSLAELGEADLIIGADGANSLVRQSGDFGTKIDELENRFAWFGTRRSFDSLTQTFVRTDRGTLNAHHYRYSPEMSTFIVEADPQTWRAHGFDGMSEEDSRAACERIFAGVLEGAPLITNRSIWRRFPKIWNERWSVGNRVLIGDSLRTAHFSIGSGTRLALEDAIALVEALDARPDDVPQALADFEAARRPIVEKLVAAANRSADWYERFPAHMQADAYDFAWNYIGRSGRVDPQRLRQLAPKFVAAYEARKGAIG